MPERYKEEIEDILQQAGELGSGKRARGSQTSLLRLVWLHTAQSLGGRAWSLRPGRVMLVGLSLLVSALIVGMFLPGFTAPLAWAGFILFIVAYAMFFVRPPKLSGEKRWRGQPIDYGSGSWWDRLRRRIK